MINRSYLAYKSAREYIGRGMAKWMGFFLAEHTVALNSTDCGICFDNKMDEEEKLFFLSYAFINKLKKTVYNLTTLVVTMKNLKMTLSLFKYKYSLTLV